MSLTDFERLVVQLGADLRGYENAMRKAVGVTNSRAREIEQRYRRMSADISNAVSAPLAGIGAALSVREITRYADAWTTAGNQIAAAGQASGVQVRSLESLRAGADDARSSLEQYAGLYASLIRSASGVAKSEEEIAEATNLVSKAMVAGGASIQEQQNAIQQLGQALASGVLQGDELRSLRENAPVLAQAIADEFGVAIGKLKDLGAEGKLTSDRVFGAILRAQPQIEAQFAKTNETIGQGLTRLGNALTEYVGKIAESSGLTAAINTVFEALAGNLDAVGAAAAAAGAILLSSYVPALARASSAGAVMLATNPFLALAAAIGTAAFALSAFGDEIQPVEGELATLQDYAGAAWEQIASGAETAGTAISSWFLGAINLITDAMAGVTTTWAQVGDFIQGSVNRYIGLFVSLAEVVRANFTVLPQVVAAAAVAAMNGMIAAIEAGINKVVGMINGLNGAVNAATSAVGLGDIIPELSEVSLGRIANSYAEGAKAAGTAAADAISEAMNRDYLGDAFAGLQDQANLSAFKRRIESSLNDAPVSSAGYGSAVSAAADAAGGSGGGGRPKGRKRRKDELEKEIESIKKRTAALVAETSAQAGLNPVLEDYGYAVARATALQDLLTAAQEAGVSITPQMRAQIEGLAEAYAQAEVAAAQMDEQQQRIRDRADEMQQLRETTTRGLVQDLIEGKSAAEAFASALGKVGDRLLDMAFSDMFSNKGGGSGILGAIGGLFGGFRAAGGPVSAGKAYVVGERRPELFVPSQSGHILPAVPRAVSSTGGGSNVSMVIDVTGATGNAEVQRMVAAGVAQGMAQVRREVPGINARFQQRNG